MKLPVVKPDKDYLPGVDEPYMSAAQLTYFENILIAWRAQLQASIYQTLEDMRAATKEVGDEVDHAARVEQQNLELGARERASALIKKIDSALKRIESGEYGYCEITGEPIGVPRLLARPIATLCLYAQEMRERRQRCDAYSFSLTDVC